MNCQLFPSWALFVLEESVTIWHVCKLLISSLAVSCKSKGFSRLRLGMCMTTLCSSRPWYVLRHHGGRGLSEESNPEARALRERKAGCSCWALEDSDFNLLCSISFFSFSLSRFLSWLCRAQGTRLPLATLKHPDFPFYIYLSFVSNFSAKILKDHQPALGGESLSCSDRGRERCHPRISRSCFLLAHTFLWNTQFCIITLYKILGLQSSLS